MGISYGITTKWQAKRGIVQDGLVLNLDAGVKDSYNGGATWRDLKGSNDGTLQNNPAFDSDNGGSISFDGTDDHVNFSDDMIDANQDWTLSTFINLSASQVSTIICGPSQSLQVRLETSGVVKVLHSTVAAVGTFSNFTASLNVWYNLIVTRSSNTYSLYINNQFKSSVTSSLTFNNSPNKIGTREGHSEFLSGKLSNLSLYNRALTAAEVSKNFNVMRHRFGI